LLKGDPEDPSKPGWGGQYVRAWDRPHYFLTEMPTENDSIEEFGIVEFALSVGESLPENPTADLKVDNQSLTGYFKEDSTVRFRFSPKSDKVFKFEVISNVSNLNGKRGALTVYIPKPELADQPSEKYPNWWTDDPRPEFMEGSHIGAKTVNQWRVEFLTDFSDRMNRCKEPYAEK
jgi:hypothetical protein